MLEPSLVRRIVAGVVVACLVLGAGVLGWIWALEGNRAQKVDQPAVGGVLVQEESQAGEGALGASAAQAVPRQPPQPAFARKPATAVTPSRSGSRAKPVHQVRQGETLYRIAKSYGVGVADLQKANGLSSELIQVGQVLVLPGRAAADQQIALGSSYAWPVQAPVSSLFGPRWGKHHNGIDLAANQGDQIRASQDGEVWVAGTVPGYGETVILAHADGSRTLYAHCSKLLVKSGQRVKKGQVIALVGSTGQSTGPHLHFEIIVNDRPIDPLLYLPKQPND